MDFEVFKVCEILTVLNSGQQKNDALIAACKLVLQTDEQNSVRVPNTNDTNVSWSKPEIIDFSNMMTPHLLFEPKRKIHGI